MTVQGDELSDYIRGVRSFGPAQVGGEVAWMEKFRDNGRLPRGVSKARGGGGACVGAGSAGRMTCRGEPDILRFV